MRKKDNLISVIIPVYNVHLNIINRCLESIKKQQYQNWEIIIVDDGSSKDLARSYDMLREQKISIIHQENRGVSSARNKGVALANGEFITFVDADDYLTPFAFLRGIHLIEIEHADMVIGAVVETAATDKDTEKTIKECSYITLNNEYSKLQEMCLNNAPPEYLNINGKGKIMRGPFARIMRSHIARSNPFPENIILGEDIIWNLRLQKKCQRICIDFNIWYYYVMNMDSAIHKYYGNRKELVTDYLKVLMTENPGIQILHKNAFVKNMAIEFYCILNYDLMSPQCSMPYKEKINAANELFNHPLWKLLSDNYLSAPIPMIHKIFILLTKCKIWPIPLRIYNTLKKRVHLFKTKAKC